MLAFKICKLAPVEYFKSPKRCLGYSSISLVKNITINSSISDENRVPFNEEIKTAEEKMVFILNVGTPSAKWIQFILEIIFEIYVHLGD